MSHARKVFAVAGLAALAWAVAPVAQAQKPIRIGATVSQTGAFAALGPNQLRGYQLCVKHMNEKGGVDMQFWAAHAETELKVSFG